MAHIKKILSDKYYLRSLLVHISKKNLIKELVKNQTKNLYIEMTGNHNNYNVEVSTIDEDFKIYDKKSFDKQYHEKLKCDIDESNTDTKDVMKDELNICDYCSKTLTDPSIIHEKFRELDESNYDNDLSLNNIYKFGNDFDVSSIYHYELIILGVIQFITMRYSKLDVITELNFSHNSFAPRFTYSKAKTLRVTSSTDTNKTTYTPLFRTTLISFVINGCVMNVTLIDNELDKSCSNKNITIIFDDVLELSMDTDLFHKAYCNKFGNYWSVEI